MIAAPVTITSATANRSLLILLCHHTLTQTLTLLPLASCGWTLCFWLCLSLCVWLVCSHENVTHQFSIYTSLSAASLGFPLLSLVWSNSVIIAVCVCVFVCTWYHIYWYVVIFPNSSLMQTPKNKERTTALACRAGSFCTYVVNQIRLRVLNTHKSVVMMSGWWVVCEPGLSASTQLNELPVHSCLCVCVSQLLCGR